MNQIPILTNDDNLFGVRINNDMNSLQTILIPKHSLFLFSDIKNETKIFSPSDIIIFLSGLNCTKLTFSSTIDHKYKIKDHGKEYLFERKLNIYEDHSDNDDH
ncbi:hypothetical protein M9Y10_023192 [Tritrichomonas musculus]|uniref:Uncharacterized protein n=1 Tax=Tritrichomonas musculus TaxID=1915356 RepID=A0ABR2KXL3_9EUKA